MMKLPKILRPRRSFEESPGTSPKQGSLSPKPSKLSGLFSPKSSSGSLKSPLRSPSRSGSLGAPSPTTSSIAAAVQQDIKTELTAVFKLFDTNGDGRICASELEAVLKCLGDAPTAGELMKMVEEVDSDGDGLISLEEFISFNAESAATTAELKAVFHVFDIDRNGFISADELHRVLVGLGDTSLTMEDCGRMIRGVDSNGDGRVDFEEFKVMMASA